MLLNHNSSFVMEEWFFLKEVLIGWVHVRYLENISFYLKTMEFYLL
jgi:hypothetical protein